MRVHGAGRVTRVALALTGVAFCLANASVLQALPAYATTSHAGAASSAGTATIRGVVLLAVAHTPVPRLTVTLHGASASTAGPLTATAVTDTAGRFAFPGLAGGPDWTYTATAAQDGVVFTTDVISVDSGATVTVTLSVFETTTASAPITRKDWTVWLDITGATIAVEQDVTLVNSAGTAYRSDQPIAGAPDKGNAAVILPVVQGADNLQYVGWFEVCCDVVSGTTWAHTRPIPPGTTTGTLRYEASTPSTLTFPVDQPTTSFTLLVPQGTSVSSPALTSAGTQSDRGTTYQVLRAGPLAAGATITVELATTSGPPWGAIGVGAAALASAALGVWWWRRRRKPDPVAARPTTSSSAGSRRPKVATSARAATKAPAASTQSVTRKAPVAQGGKPRGTTASTTKAAGKPAAVRTSTQSPNPAPPPATETRPAARSVADAAGLADELAMLDLAHDSGALPDEESYQRVRESLVARLMAAMSDDPDALRNPPAQH